MHRRSLRKIKTDQRYSMIATADQIIQSLKETGIKKPWDEQAIYGFEKAQNQGSSLISRDKDAHFSGCQGDMDLDRAREAISTLRTVLPRIQASHMIIFRSILDPSKINEFQIEWSKKCHNLEKSLFDIPKTKSKRKYSHIVCAVYYNLYFSITKIDSFSSSGPAVRFISDLMERTAKKPSNTPMDWEVIYKALRKRKKDLGDQWNHILQLSAENWIRAGQQEKFTPADIS